MIGLKTGKGMLCRQNKIKCTCFYFEKIDLQQNYSEMMVALVSTYLKNHK